MTKNSNHIAGGFILVFSALFALGLLVYAFRTNALAGVSPYDVPTPTIQEETIVKETLPDFVDTTHAKNEYECPEEGNCVYGELNKEVVEDLTKEALTDLDIARKERKVICHEAYKTWKEKVINHDKVVERCATMMTLQYAFESGHGKSRKCLEQKNCLGIKNNKRDRCIKSPNGFCTYSAQIEGLRDFAELFMKHYEGYKSIKAYLDVYSPDGNGAYPQFVKSKYDETLTYFLNN